VILDTLLEERNVTRTAKRLGVTQSAVSHALKRLREHFEDPLLVRTSAGMTPTPRAEEIAEPIRRGLETIQQGVRRGARFQPATARRSFVIATTDQIGVLWLPALYRKIASTAPHVDLRVTPIVRDVERTLDAGAADVVLTGAFEQASDKGLFRQRLREERLVCLVRAGRTDLKEPLTLEQFCALSHVLIAPRGGKGIVDRRLAERGLVRRVAVQVPHFLVAPFLVAGSDLVLTVAESVARTFLPLLPLRVLEPPLELPPAAYWQVWHERSHRDAAHAWLRGQIAEAVQA
jgi:DNA-binding transcriptional LysR family regulator